MINKNVCKEIDCPYYNSKGSCGCTFYTFASQCHLLPAANLDATEYFIYAENADIPLIREKNDRYLATNERYLRDNDMKQREGWGAGIQFPSRTVNN